MLYPDFDAERYYRNLLWNKAYKNGKLEDGDPHAAELDPDLAETSAVALTFQVPYPEDPNGMPIWEDCFDVQFNSFTGTFTFTNTLYSRTFNIQREQLNDANFDIAALYCAVSAFMAAYPSASSAFLFERATNSAEWATRTH